MKTHISISGILYKLTNVTKETQNMRFIGYGRYVNPNGNYMGAEVMGLYVDLLGKYWGKL